MNSNRYARLAALSALVLCSNSYSDEYDFEVGVTIGQSDTDTTTVNFPAPIDATATSSAEADRFELRGRWFYSGLSDDKGPKSRAAFVDRASSISLSYSQSDQSSSVVLSGTGIPPVQSNASIDLSSYSVDLRHVWKDSGWYGIMSIGKANIDAEFSNGSTTSTSDFDTNAYSLGLGKYLAEMTSVDLRLLSQDTGSSTAAGVALSFSHLAQLSDTWMFGVDAALTKTDTAGDGDAYNIVVSLFPNSDVNFGLSFARRDEEGGIDTESLELFAGWFVTGNTRVFAGYREDTGDAGLSTESDSTGFEVGFSSRF